MNPIDHRVITLNEMPAYLSSTTTALINSEEPYECELTTAAIASIEQGVWTVISYFAEMDLKSSLAVARHMRCSITSIHELDWKRFEEAFGSKGKFVQRYSNTLIADDAKKTAHTIVRAFKEAAGIHRETQIRSDHAGRIYRIGNVIGSAAALGEVYKISIEAAKTISGIVSAPIPLDSSSLLTEIATI